MNSTKEQLQEEKNQLDQRLSALAESSNNEGAFRSLGYEQQGLILQQKDAMQKYSQALAERIRTFQDNTAPVQQKAATDQPRAVQQPPVSDDPKEGSKTLAHKQRAQEQAAPQVQKQQQQKQDQLKPAVRKAIQSKVQPHPVKARSRK